MVELFKLKTVAPAQEKRVAPGTNIAFDPGLVAKLKSDHRHLLDTYSHIQTAANTGKYASLPELFTDFQSQLLDHLLTEKVKLYIFLSHQFEADDVTLQIVRDFQREMDGIAKAGLDFVRKYRTTLVDNATVETFQRELEGIGAAVSKRMQREEEVLYPLYRTM